MGVSIKALSHWHPWALKTECAQGLKPEKTSQLYEPEEGSKVPPDFSPLWNKTLNPLGKGQQTCCSQDTGEDPLSLEKGKKKKLLPSWGRDEKDPGPRPFVVLHYWESGWTHSHNKTHQSKIWLPQKGKVRALRNPHLWDPKTNDMPKTEARLGHKEIHLCPHLQARKHWVTSNICFPF